MDRRCYNGCLSDDLREYYANIQKYEDKLKNKFPTAWVTYFPVEPGYMVAMWGKNDEFIQLSEMHGNKIDAILEALKEN